jgi:hypothetical protein
LRLSFTSPFPSQAKQDKKREEKQKTTSQRSEIHQETQPSHFQIAAPVSRQPSSSKTPLEEIFPAITNPTQEQTPVPKIPEQGRPLTELLKPKSRNFTPEELARLRAIGYTPLLAKFASFANPEPLTVSTSKLPPASPITTDSSKKTSYGSAIPPTGSPKSPPRYPSRPPTPPNPPTPPVPSPARARTPPMAN